jgi:endonuclease/exonuclease/phosphatase family metal-dependent hydrolase
MRSRRFLFCLLLVLLSALAAPTLAQTSVSIHDIMVVSPGTSSNTKYYLPDSLYLYSHYGSTVSVSGIVVGVMSGGDFPGTVYISEPSSSWDSLIATAEGMPVFGVASVNSACAVVGATITVVGEVVESNTVVSSDITAADTPGTGVLPTSCTVTSTSGTMTQSISPGSTLNSFGGALEYTGMTMSATFYAVSPTSGTLAESTETQTSTGQFWATLASNSSTNNHLFRSAGIAGDEYTSSTAPSTVATWAGNPQRVLIDTTTFGGSPVNITVGQTITCTTGSGIAKGATAGIGLIDYVLGYARLLIFSTSVCTVGGTVATTTSATADSTHFHVGTLDLNRFYSTTGATTGSVAVTAAAYATRLAKAASAIVNSLGEPDILSLQEVQDLPTLTDLANSVNSLATDSPAYVPSLTQGNDANSLNLGFLVKSKTVVTDSVTQMEASNTYTTASGGSATLWERPPLVLQAEFKRSIGSSYPVTVLDVHLIPRDNIGDATLGPDIRAHRAAQASALSALVQSYQTAGDNVVVAGNLNAFEFSDGYVDVTGIINGSPAAAKAVTLYQVSSTTAALADFNTQVAATSRYNYIERGDAVTYEHILASATVSNNSTASASLASYVSAVTQPHFSADFAAINANTSTTAAGLTPHDGFVVSFLIPPSPTTASTSPTTLNFGNIELNTASAAQTVTVTNTTTFTSTVNVTNIAISGTNAADFSQTSSCLVLSEGSTCTVSITFTPSALGARTATLTVTSDSTSDPTLSVALTGTGLNTTATLTPITATFASTDVGATSAAQIFTFTNTSAATAETVGTPTVTGNYVITANTCVSASIAAAGACTISVTFNPTAPGTLTGTLTVPNSSTGNATLTATLAGTGLDTTAMLTPTTASFGSVYAGGGTSAATIFTVTNTSTVAISINSVKTSSNFTNTTTCSGTLAAGATCTVSVVFAPTAAGSLSGSLTVVNTTTGDGTLTATLTGTGLPTTATLTPASAAFGNIILGLTSTVQSFIWTNTSLIPLTVSSAVGSGDFIVSSNGCGVVAAGGFCLIGVQFAPTALGARTGTLTVTSTASANVTLTSALSGRGVADVESSASSLAFGNVDIGSSSAAQTLTVTNYTNASIALTSIAISGDFAETTTCGSSLAGQSSCTVSIVFTPTATGTRAGTLTINTNDTKYPIINVALTGNGVDFAIVIAPTSGSVIAGFGVTPSITLTPIGGFNSSVTVTCSTTATASLCTPAQTTVQLTSATSFDMPITTTAEYAVIGYGGVGGSGRRQIGLSVLVALSGLLLLGARRRLRRSLARLLMLLLLAVSVSLGLGGCSSKFPDSNAPYTAPGSYTYTVSVTDGVLTRTATYTLSVAAK